jgi:dTDP-4-dehydrorhamnose reductase
MGQIDLMKKKLLIIGGASLIGSTIINQFKNDYDIHLTYNKTPVNSNFSQTKLNLLDDRNQISSVITNLNPDVVVNTVAYPNVDFCETHHNEANLLHVLITDDLVSVCSDISSPLVYFSTDAVFDGTKSIKYTEDDKTSPLSYYGKTKLEAEKIILKINENIVLRTTVVYDWHIRSRFTNWVLKNLKQGSKITAFTDQSNTATLAGDISNSLFCLLDQNHSGLFHCAGKTCLSRYDFAIKLADYFGYDKKLIIPTISKNTQSASRPENGCLDSSKLEGLTNFCLSDIDQGITSMLNSSKTIPDIFL